MKNYLKFLMLLVFATNLNSCNKDDNQINQDESRILKFKKIDSYSKSNLNKNSEFDEIEVTILSTDPLTIDSDLMEVITEINIETDEIMEFISFIENNDQNQDDIQSRQELIKQKSGWLYNSGTDCFYYGTYNYHDDGSITFKYADAATQVLMNVCGGSSDPHVESAFARNSK